MQAAIATWSQVTLRPGTTWAWPSTPANELDAALASFQQAVKDDPRDVDSFYFQGVCYLEMKKYDKAIAILKQALAINPLHASSEFVMATALQRSGHKDLAKEHFNLFQHMTSTKISAPIGLAYGEQGHYSTVTPVEEPETGKHAHDSGEAGGGIADLPGLKSETRGARAHHYGRRLHDGRDRLGPAWTWC